MWYIYTMEYYSATKKNESNMDGPRDYTKWSKSEKWMSCDTAYMQNLKKKKWYKWAYLQSRNRPTGLGNKFRVTKGERGKG